MGGGKNIKPYAGGDDKFLKGRQVSRDQRSNDMKNLTDKSTKLFLAAVVIGALAFAIQLAHADLRLVSAASDDNGIKAQEGPPLSIAFHSNSVRNANGTRNTEIYVMDPN